MEQPQRFLGKRPTIHCRLLLYIIRRAGDVNTLNTARDWFVFQTRSAFCIYLHIMATDGKKVTITYCDDYGIWPQIANELSLRLPLRNLQWRSTQRPTRAIQSLDVDINPFSFEIIPQRMMSMHTPYLNIYFVNCSDNESYKNTVKSQIKAWVDVVTLKKNQEWLIVYVPNQDTKKANNFLSMKTSIYDKIKADFNVGKRDRCTQLRFVDSETPESEAWSDFISKMKDGITTSFDLHVIQYEEDIRRLDSQRQMPGWNYCTFFILKEGLAQAFETMNLYEEALIQYDELEASFFQVLRDKALAWFGHFGGVDPGDDSANVLDFRKKPYRELITQNTISVFDFRSYLFARQCRMLSRLQRPTDICMRAQVFISSFTTSIRENKQYLSENFLESWVFSACMNIVNECETLAGVIDKEEDSWRVPYNEAKANLLHVARKQLDKIGVGCKHLPAELPFIMYLENNNPVLENLEDSSAIVKESMSNPKLLEAIESVEAFDKMYMALSTRAIKSYDACGRTRAALHVHGDIASLKYVRQKYDEAVRIFESMTRRYGEQGWNTIENCLLLKCADAQKQLGHIRKYPLFAMILIIFMPMK
ncbi:LOW QUALITY PROTEIN: hypothetical protein BC937DRAFT_89085 [Endogone sp. FLAS-F59071]|nr:LOW QUALITY PROTEIN: hypothetical protein BC937DRAFT_89085 [Endogone sp. FLAS-F59071]|eukprot:RUS22450.1 LOW QUALITY PROTEIN: hypothetical protein BC937DRAFT_89085 [Endogone sp. FLAS-F59071]